MKKKLLTLVAALGLTLSTVNMNAQAFDEGKSIVSVGYGFPNLGASLFKSALSIYPGYSVTSLGPIFAKYEYGLSEHIGLGVVFGYSSFTVKWQETTSYYNSSNTLVNATYNWQMKYSSPAFGIRFNYHFATKDKLDPYIGVAAGYRGGSYTWTTDDPRGTGANTISFNPIPVYFPITLGLRYFFTDNIGAYMEFGIDKSSVIQAGLSAKF